MQAHGLASIFRMGGEGAWYLRPMGALAEAAQEACEEAKRGGSGRICVSIRLPCGCWLPFMPRCTRLQGATVLRAPTGMNPVFAALRATSGRFVEAVVLPECPDSFSAPLADQGVEEARTCVE